jgi:ribosomal protein S18 acetylase RimI-like enzyme
MLTYRPAAEQDFEFLWDLHRIELRPHIESTHTGSTWQWDESGQRRVLRAVFDAGCTQIILKDGIPAGALQVAPERTRLVLAFIAIAGVFQGRGLGTLVMQHLQEHARHLSLPIELQVVKSNPAVDFYQRLGFEITRETTLLYCMRWEPENWYSRVNGLEPVGYDANLT